jgi:hypothetical protein
LLLSNVPPAGEDSAGQIAKHDASIVVLDIDVPQANVAQKLPFQIGGEAAVRRGLRDSFEVVFLALPIMLSDLRNRRRECDLAEAHQALRVLRLNESLRSLLQSLLESVRVVWRLMINIVSQQV